MGKQIMRRALIGAPLGIALTQIITLAISYGLGGSTYYPCVPELTDQLGSELGAVTVQAVASALWGALCGGASVIWDIEAWSLVRQTGTWFAILLTGMLITGYSLHWIPRSFGGAFRYILLFVIIFAVIWIIEYGIGRTRVHRFNQELARVHRSDSDDDP